MNTYNILYLLVKFFLSRNHFSQAFCGVKGRRFYSIGKVDFRNLSGYS
jgi:hypothetical protein